MCDYTQGQFCQSRMENWILRISDEKRPNFKFSSKILGICDFDEFSANFERE